MCKLVGNDPATISWEQQSEGCLQWKQHLTLKSAGIAQVKPFKYLFLIWQTDKLENETDCSVESEMEIKKVRQNKMDGCAFVCFNVGKCILTHIQYPLLIVEDLFEPP